MNRETCPLAKGAAIICSWSALEPAEGRFEFERQIGDKLREADKNGYHVSLAVWTCCTLIWACHHVTFLWSRTRTR